MIIKCNNLNIKQIADSGQTFRWYKREGHYIIVANHQAVSIKQLSDGIELDDEDLIWEHYLDIKRDYHAIITHYKGKDDFLDAAMAYGSGIRILNQDPFETIMTFIISANNNIKRITSSVLALSNTFGTYLKTIDGVEYYDFPTPEQLREVSVESFRNCGVGYRDKYLYDCVHDVLNNNIDLEAIKSLSDSELRLALMRLKGVGEKVANCIILFAYARHEGFPVDTWIKKVLKEQYGIDKDYNIFVESYFKPYGGIAQQYLFFYGRR